MSTPTDCDGLDETGQAFFRGLFYALAAGTTVWVCVVALILE